MIPGPTKRSHARVSRKMESSFGKQVKWRHQYTLKSLAGTNSTSKQFNFCPKALASDAQGHALSLTYINHTIDLSLTRSLQERGVCCRGAVALIGTFYSDNCERPHEKISPQLSAWLHRKIAKALAADLVDRAEWGWLPGEANSLRATRHASTATNQEKIEPKTKISASIIPCRPPYITANPFIRRSFYKQSPVLSTNRRIHHSQFSKLRRKTVLNSKSFARFVFKKRSTSYVWKVCDMALCDVALYVPSPKWHKQMKAFARKRFGSAQHHR